MTHLPCRSVAWPSACQAATSIATQGNPHNGGKGHNGNPTLRSLEKIGKLWRRGNRELWNKRKPLYKKIDSLRGLIYPSGEKKRDWHKNSMSTSNAIGTVTALICAHCARTRKRMPVEMPSYFNMMYHVLGDAAKADALAVRRADEGALQGP